MNSNSAHRIAAAAEQAKPIFSDASGKNANGKPDGSISAAHSKANSAAPLLAKTEKQPSAAKFFSAADCKASTAASVRSKLLDQRNVRKDNIGVSNRREFMRKFDSDPPLPPSVARNHPLGLNSSGAPLGSQSLLAVPSTFGSGRQRNGKPFESESSPFVHLAPHAQQPAKKTIPVRLGNRRYANNTEWARTTCGIVQPEPDSAYFCSEKVTTSFARLNLSTVHYSCSNTL